MNWILPEPGTAKNLLIPGPAGNIEAIFAAPKTAATPQGIALICHPHPLYGGAMSNKVVYTLAATALKCGLYALRFNFRGVGASEGRHDAGHGETTDTLFLVEQIRDAMPQARLVLAGFSFGAHVSLRAAAQAKPALLISIAPPFGEKYLADHPPLQHPACPWLVIHSRDDDVVRYDETVAALQQFSPPPELVTVDGAGHFFNQQLPLISTHAGPFISRHWGG